MSHVLADKNCGMKVDEQHGLRAPELVVRKMDGLGVLFDKIHPWLPRSSILGHGTP